MDVGPWGLAVVLAAVVGGAVVQGAIGFGLNLVVVPVVALVAPEALPTSMILMAVPLTVAMVVREHDHVDRRGVAWVTLGRLPGSLLGAWVVSVLAADTLAVVVGVFVVVAVATSAVGPPLPVTPAIATATGFASGAMGTASSIGGPPVALLYQRAPGPVLRSTLALTFFLGTLVSLGALAAAGEVRADQVVFALALLPGIALGYALSRPLHSWLDGRWLRPAVLVFAAVTGAAAIVRGLL